MNKLSRLIGFNKHSNEFTVRHLKDSEVGHIPSDWQVGRVKDYFTLGRGRVISKPYIRENSGSFPVYSSQSFNNGELGRIDTYDFDGSYLTWTTDGAYAGSVFFREGKFNCTNVCGTCLAKDPSVVNTKFTAYYLDSKAKQHVSYVGNPKLMNNIFAEIPIVLPPLHEQKKIVEILSSVESIIYLLEKYLIKYRFLFKAIIHNKFDLELNNSNFYRLKEIVDPHRPISYGVVQTGENISGGVPCVRVIDMNKFPMNTFSMIKTSIAISNKYQKTILKEGDLMVALRGRIGHTCLVPKHLSGSNLTRGIALISSSKNFDSDYVRYAMKSNLVSKQIQDATNGSALQEIPLKNLREIKIPLPEIEHQVKLANELKVIENLIEKTDKKKQQMYLLKQAVSADLLSGRKRVSV